MKTYRGITYKYIEWRTYNNTLASGYQCSDASLLNGLPTFSFESTNEDEMKVKIDYYLANRQSLLDAEEVNREAIISTYETKGYPLD